MTGRAVVPIAHLDRRIPEAGRIRLGVKTAKAMRSIQTFRFTSQDRQAIDSIAEQYGGDVKPWSDPKAASGQFEVITKAAEISVVLPPEPLGDSPWYEVYGGGGRERRCDGVTCEIVVKGPEGPEPNEVPCLCAANGALACKPTLHLSVILPNVRFTGVWRLTTHSMNAAKEVPGMVALIQSQQARGLVKGILTIGSERSVYGGETHLYQVPKLGMDHTVEELAAGAAQLGALPTSEAVPPERPALHAAPDPDDDVVDAELVEDDAPMSAEQRDLLSRALSSATDTEAVKAWWKGEHLPNINRLSATQCDLVLDHLAGLDVSA